MKCKSCQKEIVFLYDNNSQLIPVDEDSLTSDELLSYRNGVQIKFRQGVHIAHSKSCKDAVFYAEET